MRIALSAFRRHVWGSPMPTARDEETMKIGAAMAWIHQQGNLDDFPGSRNERLALMTTAARRGLVVWDRFHDRYRLTQLGKTQAAHYPADIKAEPGAVRKSARLFDRFEHRPYTMIAAFFAVGAALGAAAALTYAGDPPLSATQQAPDGSSALAASDLRTTQGSQAAPPQERSDTAAASVARPASAPASLPAGPTAEGTPGPIAAPRIEVDRTSPGSPPQEERKPTATISGSLAAARAAGHFDHDAAAAPVEGSVSTLEPSDPQAVSEAKPAEAKPKHASRRRGGGIRAQRSRVPTDQDWPQFWAPWGDDGGRLMFAPRARGDGEDRRAPRYHQRRNVARDGNQDWGYDGWAFR